MADIGFVLFFFFQISKGWAILNSPLALFPLVLHPIRKKNPKQPPKPPKHPPHYHSPSCPCYSHFSRPASPLVTHLEEVTPGKGKKKLHFHKESNIKGQIITSGLKTVSDRGYKLENKRFCGLRSCWQNKSFKLHKILVKLITCCSEVFQHFSFFAEFITLNPFPKIKVFSDTEAERLRSAMIHPRGLWWKQASVIQPLNCYRNSAWYAISMSSVTKDFSTRNTDLGDLSIVSYAFISVAERGNLIQKSLRIISFQNTMIFLIDILL